MFGFVFFSRISHDQGCNFSKSIRGLKLEQGAQTKKGNDQNLIDSDFSLDLTYFLTIITGTQSLAVERLRPRGGGAPPAFELIISI